MLERLDALRTDELGDLLRQSYDMVSAKSSKPLAAGKRGGSRQGKKAIQARTAGSIKKRNARKKKSRKTT